MSRTLNRIARRRALENFDLTPIQMAAFMWFGSFGTQGRVDGKTVKDLHLLYGLIETTPEGFRVTGDGIYYGHRNALFLRALIIFFNSTDPSDLRTEIYRLYPKGILSSENALELSPKNS